MCAPRILCRMSGALSNSARAASISKCSSRASSGTINAHSMFERCWSRASKSMSSDSVMSAHSGLVQPLMRQWGSAMPCSRAVLPSFSRALRASRMTSWLSSASDSANTPAHSSSAFFLLLACWLRRILCGDKTSRISVLLFFKAIVSTRWL